MINRNKDLTLSFSLFNVKVNHNVLLEETGRKSEALVDRSLSIC